MDANAVSVAVVDGKTITKTVELGGAGRGAPVRLEAVKGAAYLLAEEASQVAPENVTIKRVGKDLHLSLERGELEAPQLVIEGFYGSDGQLVGLAEDGSFHEFVTSDVLEGQDIADGGVSPLALGAAPLTGFGTDGSSGFWTPAMVGLGLLGAGGLIAAIAGSVGGGGGGGRLPPMEPEPQTSPVPEEERPPVEPEEGVEELSPEQPEGEVIDQPVDDEEVVDEEPSPLLVFPGSEYVFDYNAVGQLSDPQDQADEAWEGALSLGDLLSLGSGELFVTDDTAPVTMPGMLGVEDLDLGALISDAELESWSAQLDVSGSGFEYEMVQPSSLLDDTLFSGQ